MRPRVWSAAAVNALREATARVAAIAARQHGVISRRQLLAAGVSSATIARWARTGHLHRLHRGVFAVGHPNVSREGRLLAAVLVCGDGAVLSHSSAAWLWRLVAAAGRDLGPWLRGAIHVTIGRERRSGPRGIVVHRPRVLESSDRTVHFGIPVTTATRTLFDQSATLSHTALRRQFEQADYLELLDRRRLAELLDGAGGRRGLGTLRTLLAQRALSLDETRSVLERRVLRICRDHAIPQPAVNVPVLGYEVDFFWPDARLVVEADGGQHRGRQRDRDNERDARLTRAGILVRRYSSLALADESLVATELLEILRERS